MPYWFNVDTGQVETDDDRSQDANVMGPYDSHDAAANALADREGQHRAVGPRGQGVGQRVSPGTRSPRRTDSGRRGRRCTETA